ncbi:SDR family NAD(P)-dependent oxidoreductase [Alkalimonas amylolytica]|uniref:NAD(P)-dependent dehydrogenase, short-chain alcohol dehydrogenase family n=1 Tax=Alkalimonas amylolytica TaxID=152573 RepID=A0A1H4EZ38_ALKAM|nr:SDR family NAD(P)-dependent oxidoreductase [Alkalimonas amylolytica]SEA90304.1 NAD(P)-dependent dehydrogenase, short-chain alcohol dehydrogenase family [Alkalimonas amylolytica]
MSDALIVGGSGAIGSALIQHYGALGYGVTALSRKAAPPWAQGQGWLHWQSVDEQDSASLNAVLAQILAKTPDVVFLCQGWLHQDAMVPEKAISQLSDEHFQQSLAVNLLSPARYLQALMPYLFRQPEVKVLVLSAKVGSITDNQLGGWYSYRASKAALNMLVKTASIELKRRNKTATIVTVHPGTTASELSAPFQARVPAAQLQSPDSTAKRLAQVAARLQPEQTGLLLNWDGQPLPF